MKIWNLFFASALLWMVAFIACNNSVAPAKNTSYSGMNKNQSFPKYKFNSQNELLKLDADNYRRWVYVGTPLTPNDMNEPEAAFPEFHNVYIHPDDYNYWQKNGKWQDGTILVKELVLVGKKQEVSGNGYFMGDFAGLEVTIKDKKLYPEEPGNWAYFSFGHSYPLAETAKAFPTAACNSCHASAAADDFVFTQDYPVLRAAKNSKNKSTGYLQNKDSNSNNSKIGSLTDNQKGELEGFLTKE